MKPTMLPACLLIAMLVSATLGACDRASNVTPPVGGKTQPTTALDGARSASATNSAAAMPSASLAGAAHDADATPADLAANATYRLPGLFAADTRVLWLQQRFGEANVRVADVPGGEGETSRGVILFADDSTRRAYLYFQDEKRLRGLSLVRVTDAGSRWQFDNGIGIGTPLSKLLALNGKPIKFLGFDWDYGGAITDWNGGQLQPAADHSVQRGIRLDHHTASDDTYPMGDTIFSSDDKRFPKLGDEVVVGEISVSFPGEDDL